MAPAGDVDTLPVQKQDLPAEGNADLKMAVDEEAFVAPSLPPGISNHSLPVQMEDLPMEGQSDMKMVVPEATSRGPLSLRKPSCPAPVWMGLLALGVAMTVGLAIGISGRGKEAPVSEIYVREWIKFHAYSSENDLNNEFGPQSKAMAFMVENGYQPASETTAAGTKWAETYAISVFYFATNGPGWTNQFRINDVRYKDVCDWHVTVQNSKNSRIPVGASCNKDGRVDALQIFANGVRGRIPSELALLTDLEYLVLPDNFLVGNIPSRLARMTNMRVFDLQENRITGKIPDLQSWSKLRYLNCNSCDLTGSIPGWIDQWTSLVTLGLTENALTGSIPKAMSRLTNLANLAFDDNLLSGDLAPLEKMTSLQNLYLEKNGFSQNIGEKFLSNLTVLQALDVSDNAFIGQVPVHLMAINSMRTMDMNQNGLSRFPNAIPQDSALEFLALYNNPIVGNSFPSTIANLVNLEHLDMSSTLMKGEMPSYLGDLTRLRYLFLADTVFEGGPIPENYQKLTRLVDFSLKASSRNGTIPTWLQTLDDLFLLDLDNNDFSSTIPTELGGLDNLKYLLLQRNPNLEGEIPSRLVKSTTLALIMLDQTNVTGNLNELCKSNTLWGAAANCNYTGAPVTCTCCDICCNPDDAENTCDQKERLAQYDPQWEDNYVRYSYSFNDEGGNRRKVM